MHSFVTYLKNVRAELTHVVWPDRNQAIIHTFLIILISAIVALFIAALDHIFTGVVTRIVNGG